MAQNSKFKIKQFEWFEMETKVRQIIQQVLGPMQKRILQTSNTLHKVKINQTEDESKIQQITLMIANDPKVFETGVFQAVDQRFQQQTKQIQQLSRQIKESSKYVDQKFKILDIRMQESSQVLRNVVSLRQRISKEIQLQSDNINKLRNNLTDMIQNISAQIKECRKIIQNNLEASDKEFFLNSQRLRSINVKIQNIDLVMQNHRQMHREKAVKLEEHSETLIKHKEQITGLQEFKQLTKKLQQYVKQMDNELTRAQFKIDNICPLITQAQISDCLFNVLPNKLKKKITVHEYRKYFKLNREVLQKPYKQIKEKFNSIELLQQMQKRNTKEVVQLKRKKLLSMGIDIDHLTYQQRERYYNQVDLDQAVDQEDDEVKISNKIDEKQILNIINIYFKQFTTEISQKVKIQLSDSKRYIFDFQDQLRREMLSYQEKFNGIKRQCQTFHNEQLLENKSFYEEIKHKTKLFQKVKNEFNSVKELQRLFYNFCSLVNHLQIQDEIDKQNISLMGVHQNHSQNPQQLKGKNSILQLQKKCFSCCGYPASTLSAFKMACLAYNPSSIKIDSKEYKRQQLLQFTTNMLHNIKKGIQHDSNIETHETNSAKDLYINKPFLQSTIQKPLLQQETYEQSKHVFKLDSQENETMYKKSGNSKFRKTKKYNSINHNNSGYSSNKYPSKTKSKIINEEMANVSAAFTELKKRNISFLC